MYVCMYVRMYMYVCMCLHYLECAIYIFVTYIDIYIKYCCVCTYMHLCVYTCIHNHASISWQTVTHITRMCGHIEYSYSEYLVCHVGYLWPDSIIATHTLTTNYVLGLWLQ